MIKKTVCACFITLILAAGNGLAQGTPSLGSLVNDMKAVSLPDKPYTVSVSQTIERANKSNPTSPLTVSSVASFEYSYTPHSFLRIEPNKPGSGKKPGSTVQSVGTTGQTPEASIKVTVDLGQFLSTSAKWQEVTITPDILNSERCYKITAQEKPFDFVVWVDATKHYVPRIMLNIQGNRFSEINISYRNVSGTYWLPSQVVINHALDGSRVITSFGQYVF